MRKISSNWKKTFGFTKTEKTKSVLQKATDSYRDNLTTSSPLCNYEEAKEIRKQELLQSKITKNEKARYKNKKYSISLKEYRDELEFYFLQTVI